MDISINTPAILFPAISLVLLAYTNRFLGLTSVARKLHDEYLQNKENEKLHTQIKNLRYRIVLVRRMQFMGVISFLLCIVAMFFIYINQINWANLIFGSSLVCFSISLIYSLIEITQSTKALEIELSDMENIEHASFVDYLKQKIEE
jgi:uncharacterized membrane protein YagU involved in acid resistance